MSGFRLHGYTTKERIEDNPLLDVGVLSHGFAPHMRDYDILFEAMWGKKEWGDAKQMHETEVETNAFIL